jgi:hypothetical protein
MTSRLDELLSPDRLRDRWQEEETPPSPEAPVAPPAPDRPLALVERLEALAGARFPGAAAHGLPLLIARLRRLVEQRYPPAREAGEQDPPAEAPAEDGQLRELLDQIEDLVEALDLGRRR